jgi:hypothetical protein
MMLIFGFLPARVGGVDLVGPARFCDEFKAFGKGFKLLLISMSKL